MGPAVALVTMMILVMCMLMFVLAGALLALDVPHNLTGLHLL